MDEEDRELLRENSRLIGEHSRLIKEVQEDFQKFYKAVKYFIPEIEHTKTLTRMEKEMEESMKKIKIDIV
jgi:hypothetical protein|tara:strand:- start:302 stop:511 length:210 start_codon:yes stop_codon:yes gene_type:complete